MIMDTNTQIRVVVFCTVISVMVATLLPVFAPVVAYSNSGYDADEIIAERQELEAFTGQSMYNQSPFVLTGVYTPYITGVSSSENYTKDGVLYGTSVSNYQYIGNVTNIKLDPDHKSQSMLISSSQSLLTPIEAYHDWYTGEHDWWAFWEDIENWWNTDVLGEDPTYIDYVYKDYTNWVYTGYRYVFEPSLNVDYETNTGTTSSTDRMSLSIVWYDIKGSEGISGGLVIYDNARRQMVANLTMDEIIADYNIYSNKASVYNLSFDALTVKMAIRFDQTVLDGSQNMSTAWTNGDWSIGFYAASISNFLDVDGSASYNLTLGGIVETYTQIFTLTYPSLGDGWDIVIWILCSLPMMLIMVNAIVAVIDVIKPSWL